MSRAQILKPRLEQIVWQCPGTADWHCRPVGQPPLDATSAPLRGAGAGGLSSKIIDPEARRGGLLALIGRASTSWPYQTAGRTAGGPRPLGGGPNWRRARPRSRQRQNYGFSKVVPFRGA